MPRSLDDVPSGEETCRIVRERFGGTCLLSFSGGKDSIAAWIQCERFFDRVIPYYGYVVPDLEFVEDHLQHCEDVFGTHIVRVPHPTMYHQLNTYVFQSPTTAQIIQAARLPNFNFELVHDVVALDNGLRGRDVLTATGLRASDNLARRTNIIASGSINLERRKFMPVWDWSIARLEDELRTRGVGLPADYEMFGRSFDGMQWFYILEIRKRFPRDYEKIKEMFPLMEVEFFRKEMITGEKVL